jgi:lactoylglutathione lyase
MAKPVHSMIRVLDEKRSLDFYARAFGLEVADHLKFPDFALIYLRHPSSPFEVELTVNFDRKEPYVLGDGYGHLAVVVDDVNAEHARSAISSTMGRRWRGSFSWPIPTGTRSK